MTLFKNSGVPGAGGGGFMRVTEMSPLKFLDCLERKETAHLVETTNTNTHRLHSIQCTLAMIFSNLFLALAVTASAVFATDYKTPPAVLFPSNYTKWIRSSGQSRLALIDIPFVNQNV
jgi:hypothetical protein